MIFIKKIRSEGGDKEYFLVTSCECGSAEFEIALVSVLNFKCYKGLLSDDYVKTRAIKTRMLYEAYLTETHSALTHVNPDRLRFIYNVTELDSDDVVFEWKKNVEEEELKILLGSINLSSFVTADLVILLFSNLSTELQHLHHKIDDLTEEQHRLKTEREDLLNMLEETNEWKARLEKEMYAKFVIVLNSKKKKIKELKDQLEQYMGAKERKRTTNKQVASTINSENKEERNANNSLDIFSDEEVSIASTSRIGRYISSNQQSIKKMKLEEFTAESKGDPSRSDKVKMLSEQNHTLLLSDPDSDDLFDEL